MVTALSRVLTESEEEEVTTEPPIPGLKSYTMFVKVTGLANSFKPPARGTTDYEELSQQLTSNLGSALGTNPGYKDLTLDDLMQNETSSMLAEFTLRAVDTNSIETARALGGGAAQAHGDEEEGRRWERAVRDVLAGGSVGNLNVDPQFLVFEPRALLSTTPPPVEGNARSFFGASSRKLHVVIACVCALVLVAVVQAACTLHRTRIARNARREQLIQNTAWKDYSPSNTNYAFEPFESDDKYNSTASTAPLRERPSTVPLRPTNPPPPRPHSAAKMVPNGDKMATNGHKMAANGSKAGHSNTKDRSPKYPNSAAQYYHETRSLQRPRGQYSYTPRPSGERAYSLPRGPRAPPASEEPQPDFYFMPSQRKYEGSWHFASTNCIRRIMGIKIEGQSISECQPQHCMAVGEEYGVDRIEPFSWKIEFMKNR
ncbi:hypothetical protein EVAR_58968_1 [Eumeta japonica]|uniref:SEA domain-containing protein n=1 Tax=Eumeta variegata TaxID=151549 RepID=A0A4C1YJ85_EUMVA|nr:hypothetical protein EVAR_58968_1 [Eumeta japonica]